jgi:predicted amidophosphoribosyltransferase
MLDVLLPVVCAVCGALGASPCASCIDVLRRPAPLPPPLGVDRLVALLAYEGAGRELVARVKYRNARAAVGWLAAGMAGLAEPLHPDLVTWVPTTVRRRRRRGFDQARLLAAAVARELRVPAVSLLTRGSGPPQTGRSGEERRKRPDLRPTRRAPGLVLGARVLLVDDVCTSGTTLTAAAHALRAAGADSVSAAVAARTPRYGMVTSPLKVTFGATDPISR